MTRFAIALAGLMLGVVLLAAPAQEVKKPPVKPLPPMFAEALKLAPEEFLKRFDKDGNGTLSKEELPPFFARPFERVDGNGDGKLDRAEVAELLQLLRGVFSQAAPPGKEVEKFIDKILLDQDADKDGKIARAEAQGRLKEAFERLDTDGDGFLDRQELRVLAQRLGPMPPGAPKKAPEFKAPIPDFDALDKNADGRLSREELQATPHAARFGAIDTDNSGLINRREWEAFFRKQK